MELTNLFNIWLIRTTLLLAPLKLNYQHTSWPWRPRVHDGGPLGCPVSWRTLIYSPSHSNIGLYKQGIESSPSKAQIFQGSFVTVAIFFFLNKFILSSPRQIRSIPPKGFSHYCLDSTQLVTSHPLYLSTSVTFEGETSLPDWDTFLLYSPGPLISSLAFPGNHSHICSLYQCHWQGTDFIGFRNCGQPPGGRGWIQESKYETPLLRLRDSLGSDW